MARLAIHIVGVGLVAKGSRDAARGVESHFNGSLALTSPHPLLTLTALLLLLNLLKFIPNCLLLLRDGHGDGQELEGGGGGGGGGVGFRDRDTAALPRRLLRLLRMHSARLLYFHLGG